MAARLFQSILLEIKEKVPFTVGVVDQPGNIISCTEIKLIGDTMGAFDTPDTGPKQVTAPAQPPAQINFNMMNGALQSADAGETADPANPLAPKQSK